MGVIAGHQANLVRVIGPARNGRQEMMRKKTKGYSKGGKVKMQGGGMKKTKARAKGGKVKMQRGGMKKTKSYSRGGAVRSKR